MIIERIGKTYLGVVVVGGMLFSFALGLDRGREIYQENKEFRDTYQRALFQYADENRDGFISASENDEFDRKLLSGKGVSLIHGNLPKYKNGKEVPISLITEWIRNYKPSE